MSQNNTVVDFTLLRIESAQLLVQRRAFDRRLFPGMWELPGGHLETDETIDACIRRELWEECRLRLRQILGPLHRFQWPDGTAHWIYAITADGDPVAESGKVLCQKWIAEDEVGLLQNGASQSEELVIGAHLAFKLMGVIPR
jgi:8-oxo-dGTP pyrophosphatase MutT (NUDIX family)